MGIPHLMYEGTIGYRTRKTKAYVGSFKPFLPDETAALQNEEIDNSIPAVEDGTASAAAKEFSTSMYKSAPIVNINKATSPEDGNILRKVGAFIMPSVSGLYTAEMKDSYTDNVILKGAIAVFSTIIFTLLGVQLSYLLLGLFIMALGDALLGTVLKNYRPETAAEHAFDVKFKAFLTNFIGMLVIVKGFESLAKGAPPWAHLATSIFVVTWVYGIYAIKIVKYIAYANNTKAPKWILAIFKMDKDPTSTTPPGN